MRRQMLCCLVLVSLIIGIWPASSSDEEIDVLLASMTLEEKVGQMFMVSLYGKRLTDAGENLISTYHPGAVALFGYNVDYERADHIALLINEMQTAAVESGAEIPLFIAADQEGGRVQRIVNGVTHYPDPLYLGAIMTPEPIRGVGAATGAELRALGVNMNLAPVADLQSRPDEFDKNRVLYRRTFGDDAGRVGWQVAAYSAGLADSGVVGVVKHFPGHGGTVDSHHRLPMIDTEAEIARQTALASFESAVDVGIPAVMVGHLYYSALEPVENLPSSLSPTLIGILREEFGFEGIIMTDALDMNAVSLTYSIPDAALMSVQAGVDMVVMGPNVSWASQHRAIQAVIDAVNAGDISESRIDESVRRLLTVKSEYSLLAWEPTDLTALAPPIDLSPAQDALLEAYAAAVTVVKDESALLPLSPDERVAVAYPVVYERIYSACLEQAQDIKYFGYVYYPTTFDYNAVLGAGVSYDKVVIFVEDAWKNLSHRDLVLKLPPEKTIVVALNSPYDLESFPDISTYVTVYSSNPASHAAACEVLFGARPAVGRLPITVGDYQSGAGIDSPAHDN